MKHARRIQTSEMDIRRRLGSTRENAERKARKIRIVVGFDSEDNLRAGYQEHTAKTVNWWDKDLDVMMHIGIGVRELPQNWEDIMFGSSKAQKLSKVDFSNVWQIAKYATQSGYIAKMHPGYTPKNALRPTEHFIKKALRKIQLRMKSTNASRMGIQQLEENAMKMKSTKASKMGIQQRLGEHAKEKAAKKKTMDIEAFVGIDADAKLFAGWQHAEGRMDWKDEDKDIAMHVYMNPSKLPEDWKKLFFGKKRVPAKRFHKVAFSQVEQIAKHITNLGHLHPGDSPKKTMQKLKQKMKSTKASIDIRQRLMQLDDENSQESAVRDTITKVPSMTTKKMKEVLPDLKLSYINLMTLLSLIDSGRNAPEELPKGFGKKELKIAVNEARMIWLWLQSNSIRLGFNFKEYT